MTSLAGSDRILQVGDTVTLEIDPISRSTLALFAGGSGDHNPIHLDVDLARAAGMTDVFAQGMLSMAFLARLITDNFAQASLRSFSTRFVAITPINAEPTCRATVLAEDGDLLRLDLSVVLGDETVTLAGHATISKEPSSS